MTLFGKDTQKLEVISAEFLPDGNQLYFVVVDAESNIHILQYDPERTYLLRPPTYSQANLCNDRPQIPCRPTSNPPSRLLLGPRNLHANHASPLPIFILYISQFPPSPRRYRHFPITPPSPSPKPTATRIFCPSRHSNRQPRHDPHDPGNCLPQAQHRAGADCQRRGACRGTEP